MKAALLSAAQVRKMIPPRPADSHKGRNGHVLLVAGSRGMSGAAVLSALGALKIGAGLVTVALPESARKILTTRLPEAMTVPLPEAHDGSIAASAVSLIQAYVRRRTITTLAVGPGLTVHPGVARLIKALIKSNLPLVLDADGLNNIRPRDIRGSGAVITPHPGEMARLLAVSTKEVQKNREGICRQTARNLGVICVLKGHRTVISDGRRMVINPTGNSAMAAGGMGDVLTGVIASFIGQGLCPFNAACAGVYLHGLAGDLAAKADRGLLATELATALPLALKKVQKA